ncbi:hypothetical protein V8E53_004201 [Lactarius tabidus]
MQPFVAVMLAAPAWVAKQFKLDHIQQLAKLFVRTNTSDEHIYAVQRRTETKACATYGPKGFQPPNSNSKNAPPSTPNVKTQDTATSTMVKKLRRRDSWAPDWGRGKVTGAKCPQKAQIKMLSALRQ